MFLPLLFIKNRQQHSQKAQNRMKILSPPSPVASTCIHNVVLCKQLNNNNNLANGCKKVAHSNLHTGKIAHAALLSQNVFHLDSRPHWLNYPHGIDSSLSLAPPSADEVIQLKFFEIVIYMGISVVETLKYHMSNYCLQNW